MQEFLDATMNETVFFISFMDCLLVYRNGTDFHMLILYPATWLNLLVLTFSVCVQFLGFST